MSKDARINFLSNVSTIIWKRAGGICSIRNCLRPVFGTDGNLHTETDKHRATTIGEAAHIYSAKPNWARGQGSKSPEFIESAENGISTCRNCHRNVDTVESKYSAETLFEMKFVRETAQDITRHHPLVGFYVTVVGIRELDELVWGASNRSNVDEIAAGFIKYAEQAVQILRLIKETQSQAMPKPVGFVPLKLVAALEQTREPELKKFNQIPVGLVQKLTLADTEQSEADQIARTLDLAEGWSCGMDNVLVVETVRCDVFTRDLLTGVTGEPVRFNVRAGVFKTTNSDSVVEISLEVEGFESLSVGFDWRLKAAFDREGHRLESTMKLRSFACPDHTEELREFRIFEGYARLLKEIDQGKAPFARLSRLNAMSRDRQGTAQKEDAMHPLEFVVNMIDSPERIRDVVAFNDKAIMGHRVSIELDAFIVYRCGHHARPLVNDSKNPAMLGFFDHALTEQMIREAIEEVREKALTSTLPRFGVVSKPLVLIRRFEQPHIIRAHHKNSATWFRLEPVASEPKRR